MSRPRSMRLLGALLVVVLAGSSARAVSARVPSSVAGQRAVLAVPAPVLPFAGERVPESIARFEVAPARGARDVRVVAARFAFDPSGWTAVPSGAAWTVVPCGSGPVPIAPLALADRTDTRLWWAVVWTDARTGALRSGEVRSFTLVPRFTNRAAPDGTVRPSATGRLPERAAPAAAPHRPIELAAGYTLVPGAPAPAVPAALQRAGAAPAGGPTARGTYLVEFGDESPAAARARIARAGGTVVAPVAGEGWLVRMTADASLLLANEDGQPWIAPFEPAYKLSSALDLSASGTADVTALLFADGDDDATLEALRAMGATNLKSHRGPVNHLARFELALSRLPDVASLADVAWIEPTPRDSFSNDMAQWVVQSGTPNARTVWDHGLRGQGQVVMTSDSGIRTNHEMFYDSTQAINGWGDYPTNRKIIAYKPGSTNPGVVFGDDVSSSYHGTHTAGTVAGNPDPYSTAPWSGVAKDAKLYFMDMSGPGGNSALYPPDDLNDLYQPSYTGNAGGAARISSNSWGSSSSFGSYTINALQIDQFVWNHPDYLIAFASGNVGVFSSVQSPGTAKNCLTVGASGNGELENTLASFSSRGPAKDGRRKPTVCAPGDGVTSSIGSTRYMYATYSGTSMATPAVAGAMALVRQYLTEGWYPTGAPVAANAINPSAALMRAMAVAAARSDVIGFNAPDNSIGYGRLTIDDVLYFPGDALRTLLVDPQDGLDDQQYVEYQVQVSDPTQPLKVALCWTDAPGNPAVSTQIVNDLDLVVTHAGSTWLGNYLLNNVSVTGGRRDSLNVEEYVRLATPAAGLYTVRVEARRVWQGPQRFALCITGGVGGPIGSVALDRFQYSLADTLAIEVTDTDAPATVTALVSSTSEPWNEAVTLTGSNGVYRGSLPIAPVAAVLGDGVLAVSSGDLVTVSYTDATPGAKVAATARVNVQAPTISEVRATALSSNQAVVSWVTDVPSSARVHFGPTAALGSVADSSSLVTHHAVLLTGLRAGSTYVYDVESRTRSGDMARDSLGGAHRSFTTRAPGSLAVLMDDASVNVLATWNTALADLGWDADVYPAASNDPPLVGNSSAGLRSYNAVLWQVGQNNYPPFSVAQRVAVDSLLDGGGRMLFTGHDIGYGLSDMDIPMYDPAAEAWFESGLKTRFYLDNYYADTLTGVPGSPISGPYTGSVYYDGWIYPDAGDNVGPAPGTDGVWTGDWTDNALQTKWMGMHWESNAAKGTSGAGVWGGQTSRLVGMFFEWRALSGAGTSSTPVRTGVLQRAVSWLLGHNPPEVHLVSPVPGTVVTADFLPIKYSILPDAGRSVTSRQLDYSLDGGDTWAPIQTAAYADSGCIWDLGGALGGPPTPNSNRVMLRVHVADDGAPVLRSTSVTPGTFTIARGTGDTRGPALLAGSASCSPLPLHRGVPATLFATFSDDETGGGNVSAIEYSLGATPAPAGTGTAMSGSFGNPSVRASAALNTASIASGTQTLWVRGRDAAGNWSAATAITVPSVNTGTTAVEAAPTVDFLAPPSPNPFHGSMALRFGLARAGAVKLELFDLAGRRVRTLADGTLSPGTHVATWDGRDRAGNAVGAGVYFVRLVTPGSTFHSRVVSLD